MNRLRAIRDIEGWTQAELGELLGVSPQLISAVEMGRRNLTFSLSPTGYADSRLQLPTMSEPLHRQRAATRVSDTRRAKELLRVAGEIFIELRERQPRVPELMLGHLSTPMTLEQVEDLALEVRLLLAQELTGPVRNFTSIIERAGACLVPIAGLTGVDGISAWVDGQPVIGLSPTVSGDRFRFSLAHELAHLLFHRKKGETSEDQANRFAGAMLIPQSEVELALPANPTLRDFIGLKSSWGISVAALVYRSHELGYLDDSRYRSLQIQMSKWRRSEPGEFSPVQGALLPKLVEGAGGAAEVSRALGIRQQHVREVVNWSHLRAA